MFKRLGAPGERWTLLIEAPLLRLGKRLDAVLLAPGVVCVIEFKIGARSYAAEDRVQTERYAQSLKDFHAVSQSRLVVPILCAEHAPTVQAAEGIVDGVASLVLTNAAGLADALRAIGLVACLCRSKCSFRPLGVRRPRGFCLPTLNADGAGYRSR